MAITYGDLVNCSIEPAGDTDFFTFSAAAGEQLTLRIVRTSGSGWPKAEVYRQDGTKVLDRSGSQVARLEYTVPAAGAFTVAVSEGFDGARTFGYTLVFERMVPAPSGRALAVGDSLAGALDLPGQIDVFSFSGAAGETMRLNLLRTGGTGWPKLEAFDAAGKQILDRYGSGAVLAEVQFTSAATHTVFVTEGFDGARTFDYRLVLQRITPPPVSAARLELDQALTGKIELPGEIDSFTFAGTAGSTVRIGLAKVSGTGWPKLELFDPRGAKVRESYSSATVQMDVSLSLTGVYAAYVTEGFDGTRAFDYRISLLCLVGTCATAVVPLEITSASPLPGAASGVQYSHTLTATGGTPPLRWSLTAGSLPPGLSLNAATGMVSGAPSSAGAFKFSIQAADGAGAVATKEFILVVTEVKLTISPASLGFLYQTGGALPEGQPLSISSAGSVASFTASVSTVSGGKWLSVSSTAGATPATITVLVSPGGLARGIYAGSVTITAAGGSTHGVPVQLFVTEPDGPPLFSAAGVVNAASLAPGPVAPGEIVTIFGVGLGPVTLTSLRIVDGQVSATLAETEVFFDNLPAPLVYVAANQLSAIVPYAVAGTTEAKVQVEYRGARSDAVRVGVAPSAPGIFSVDSTGKGQGAILNQDYSVNSAANPAEQGSVVLIYATGEGETDPQVADGRLASPEVLPRPKLPVTVKIGGLEAEVLYAGAAPGQVVGLLQVNARVPAGAPSGSAVPVVLTIGAASSQPGVTLAVK
jgi:uncharacterized protein (TIGR03437 family)